MILVTGAAGFIGQHLTPALSGVYAIDVRPCPQETTAAAFCDITDDVHMAELAEKWRGKITCCVHLAAIASPPIAKRDPKLAWDTNVRGTHNVLELCHRIGCKRIVFFSSAHVYGISPRYMPTDESHPLNLHDTYTTTKILGEQLCEQFYLNHGLSYCTLRLWNAYGPGQNKDYFIGAKLLQARSGKLTIRNRNVTKDWVSVRDVVKAAVMATHSDYVGPLNVGTGVETSLGTIVSKIGEHYGLRVEVEDVPDEGPTRMRCDWSRIERSLGWRPTVTFDDGLKELLNDC